MKKREKFSFRLTAIRIVCSLTCVSEKKKFFAPLRRHTEHERSTEKNVETLCVTFYEVSFAQQFVHSP